MSFEMHGEASIRIDATPEAVYDLVSDITRMGEWSPECQGAEWIDGGGASVGSQFHGRNVRGGGEWTTPNTIIAAERGREFTWVVGTQDYQVCRWSYRFEPDGDGTKVTESFDLGKELVGFRSSVMELPDDERQPRVDARRTQLIDDMNETLAKLKETIERS